MNMKWLELSFKKKKRVLNSLIDIPIGINIGTTLFLKAKKKGHGLYDWPRRKTHQPKQSAFNKSLAATYFKDQVFTKVIFHSMWWHYEQDFMSIVMKNLYIFTYIYIQQNELKVDESYNFLFFSYFTWVLCEKFTTLSNGLHWEQT